ncbi:lauroyl acyltransferase [Acuticoccus sp. MNP-M23]|uniref:lysophospholipid acyltransferase family protein n=1 Tax=Acuticoccus sp. MNP-M23 TaxID=3072793 RepID=UPI002815C778|nr:lauroyl acyltransferase [Acuticoccus sp. MNP-M23]WMS42177.1 lauroyl acyltransferase [Acuticoccus sp. MNP-M23]
MDATNPANAPRPPRRKTRAGKATFQHRLEYAGVRAAGLILRMAPVGWTSAVMGGVLGAIMPRTSRHQRALEHLALALPELPAAEREAIARRMWRNLGRVSGESFQIDRLVNQTARVEMPADIDRFVALWKDGAVNASAHLGNWEITGVLAKANRLPFAAVYQKLHNPFVETYLKAMREPAYPAGLYPKGPQLAYTMLRLLRDGVSVGMAADFRELRGIPVRFFGQEAYATPFPAILARMTGKPLIAGAVTRTEGVNFRVSLREIPVPHTDDRDADIAAATQALHDAFEEWIRAAPDQWMWSHRKWASQNRRRAD